MRNLTIRIYMYIDLKTIIEIKKKGSRIVIIT